MLLAAVYNLIAVESALVKIGLILVVGVVAYATLFALLKRAVVIIRRRTKDGELPSGEKDRRDTIVRILKKLLRLTTVVVVVLSVLSVLGVKIGTILAGAGLTGVIIGFGAQKLVKDFIAGFFVIFEDQYRRGDIARVVTAGKEVTGVVENVSLRRTILRDLDGAEHHIPHGEIAFTSNLTKQWARVNFEVPIHPEADIAKAIEIVNTIGAQIAEDPEWSEFVIKQPRALGVERFSDGKVWIKVLGRSKASKQWDLSYELRTRIAEALQKVGVKLA
ncbi:MAG: mechanosensitive ion channel family protein [Parcubacteria group bacterium]|nr:mechanosensitive ion channel family protein [Parcubacteria group bacterium]